MRKPNSDQIQARRLMWDWIWPACLFSSPTFGAIFVILPNPHPIKLILAIVLLIAHLIIAYLLLYRWQLARIWFIFLAVWFFNFAFFATGSAMVACFRFQWPQDLGYNLLILASLVGVVYLTWRYYTPLMKPLIEADCRTGRFDLEQGTFSLAIPPSFYEFKTPLLRRATEILLPFSGILIAISAASGVHGGGKLLSGRDIGAGALSLFLATMFVATMTCIFYTYLWIRRWEKETGRTMWIKGFEPQHKMGDHSQ